MVPSQLKILMPVGTPTTMRGDGEKAVGVGAHSDGEHVVGPDAHADEPDADGGADHHRVAENRLARKDRNDFGDERESRE